MDYIPIALSLVAVAIAFYYYAIKDLDFFKRHGILHVRPIPLLGNMLPFVLKRKNLSQLVQSIYDIHPEAKYVGAYEFMNPMIAIRDPDIIKLIAVKHFDSFQNHRSFVDEVVDPYFGKNLFALRGDRWKEVRNLLTPAFTASKMRAMFELMSDCAKDYGVYMASIPEEKATTELKDVFTRYTTDVIASCAFGINIDSMRDRENEFYMNGRIVSSFNFLLTLKAFLIRNFPRLSKFLSLSIVDRKVMSFFNNTIENTIKVRDEKGITRPDMLQLMMETRGKLGDHELTIVDMTAQAFIFFSGGLETVSLCMCFAGYELAINPDIQERLQNEVDEVLEKTNGQFTYEAVSQMEYLDAILSEVLRKYPIVSMVDRVCGKELELPPALPGGKPFLIKKGMIICFPIHGLHHDPKYFDEPEKFDPGRFLKDGRKIMSSEAYIPFGIGPRMCIANRFALMETKVLFCHLMARCNFKVSPKTQIPLKFAHTGFSLMAKDGYWVKVEPRENPHPSIVVPVPNGKSKA